MESEGVKKVLVTGANGFIGKNLSARLAHENVEVIRFTREISLEKLKKEISQVDFIFHLAGVNRPDDQREFYEGNVRLTERLIEIVKDSKRTLPILYTSSIRAVRDEPYGRSKRQAEELLRNYAEETGAEIYIYRLPNVFGKWCRPYYNNVIATFCHNLARELPIRIDDPGVELTLVYIDDVVREFLHAMKGEAHRTGEFCEVPVVYRAKLEAIAGIIASFKESRTQRTIPNLKDPFVKKLYSTYLSYLPEDRFSYELTMRTDHRGSFTEFLRTEDKGQVSVNITKPGKIKGNHWHHTKNEKFLVVSGKGVIRLRKIDSDEVIEYFVSEEKLEVVDIPPGYTHHMENVGDKDLVTIMWANEPFDPDHPDTYDLEV
jgi:NAD dependent epimerase/dehydratase family./Glucose-6-phosphate isomerase (GPI).